MSAEFLYSVIPDHDPVRAMAPLFPGVLAADCVLHRALMVPKVNVELLVILDCGVLPVSQDRSVPLAR